MKLTWLEFVIGCLATYRISLLIAKEEGPAEFAKKAREAVPQGWVRRGFSCQWCQSFWWGMAVALFYAATDRITWIDFPICWLAFSAGGIVINQKFTKH